MPFQVGDLVEKKEGYKDPGVVVSVFTTRSEKVRVVVESLGKDTEGMLHIFRPEQLRELDRDIG